MAANGYKGYAVSVLLFLNCNKLKVLLFYLDCVFFFFQSRLSPFANTRARSLRNMKDSGKKLDFSNSSRCKHVRLKRLNRWFSLVDAAISRKRALLPVKKLKDSFLLNKELCQTLFGFIVFEVAWTDIRGINYLNELQVLLFMSISFASCMMCSVLHFYFTYRLIRPWRWRPSQ